MKSIDIGRTTRQDVALAVLRLGVGVIFIAHGAQKLFVFGMDGVAAGFAQVGIPLALFAAPLVSFLELLGGSALVVGLLTRPAAAALAMTMLVAVLVAHLPAGFFLPDGFEFAFAMLVGSLSLALAGAGAYSLDAVLAGRRHAHVPEIRPARRAA